MNILTLERFGYMPFGTYGKLIFPTGDTFCTVERPWLNNAPYISCIPEGIYNLGLRYSAVVKKASGGDYEEGWEVMNVPDRSYIMIHPGNWPSDVEGCIAVGSNLLMLAQSQHNWIPAVSNSRKTFRKVMTLLDQSSLWDLKVTHFCMQT